VQVLQLNQKGTMIVSPLFLQRMTKHWVISVTLPDGTSTTSSTYAESLFHAIALVRPKFPEDSKFSRFRYYKGDRKIIKKRVSF